MTRTQSPRRRPDGSIDTGFYLERGRKLRSATAHGLLRGFFGSRRNRGA